MCFFLNKGWRWWTANARFVGSGKISWGVTIRYSRIKGWANIFPRTKWRCYFVFFHCWHTKTNLVIGWTGWTIHAFLIFWTTHCHFFLDCLDDYKPCWWLKQPFNDGVRATTLIESWWIYLLLHGTVQRQSVNSGNAAGTPGHICLRWKMPLSWAHGFVHTSDVKYDISSGVHSIHRHNMMTLICIMCIEA